MRAAVLRASTMLSAVVALSAQTKLPPPGTSLDLTVASETNCSGVPLPRKRRRMKPDRGSASGGVVSMAADFNIEKIIEQFW